MECIFLREELLIYLITKNGSIIYGPFDVNMVNTHTNKLCSQLTLMKIQNVSYKSTITIHHKCKYIYICNNIFVNIKMIKYHNDITY